MSESFQGPSPWTLSQLANEDFVQAGAAGLVGLFAIVVAYTRRAEMEWQRVLAEIFLEFALTVSLVFSLRNFKREIQGVFHTRIEITVGLAYASACVSLACFVISTVATVIVSMTKSTETQLKGVKTSQKLSQFCWILYIVVSFASIFPFLTVHSAVRDIERSTGARVVTGVVALPFAIAAFNLFCHLVACLHARAFRWRIEYHVKTMYTLLTLFAAAAMVAPLMLASRRLKGIEPPKTASLSLSVMISVIVEILAALLHRFGLYRLQLQRETLEKKLAAENASSDTATF